MIQIFRQQPHGYRRDRATANSILEKKMQCAGIYFMVYMCISPFVLRYDFNCPPPPNLREIIADALSYPHVYMFYNIFCSWYIDGQQDPL